MRPFLRLVPAAVLVLASPGYGQFVGGFHQKQVTAFQVRNGPFSSFTFVSGGYGIAPLYAPVPTWYYGWPGVPYASNPYLGPAAITPPVVIQNIIQAPGAAVPPQRFIPPEVDTPLAKPAPPPKPARAGVKAVVPPVIPPPELPKPAAGGGRVEADRIAEAGRKAFADGQYGRALELFRKEVELTPNEASAYYLVSQAQFALGKYREAVAAIAAGVAVRADWPEARFVSRDLYWKKPEQFDDHLKALRQAMAAFPDDAGLLFLLGHQLWFDGKHDEARPLFQKAAALGKGTTPAEAFVAR